MPRYDYECGNCHHQFELRQGFDAETIATCPLCQHSSQRKFHSVPIVFKGSGWYVNDYGKRASATTTASEAKESSDSDGKAAAKAGSGSNGEPTSKSESKPDAAPEGKSKATTAPSGTSTD